MAISSVHEMADVRSLLRNEKAARRITHPQATYTATGVLSCKVCQIPIKSANLWQSHISSPQHVTNLKKIASGLKKGPESIQAGRKRKASEDDEDGLDNGRKKTKAAEEEIADNVEGPVLAEIDEAPASTSTSAQEPAMEATKNMPDVDEDEWAAFERDVATPPPELRKAVSALKASATISAAPMTAAELASKSRQEAGVQEKERREAELEGEREDAARRMEEELDEMDGLEERIRRLKAKREELRARQASEATYATTKPGVQIPDNPGGDGQSLDEEDEEDDNDDYDNDGWGNWGRT